MIELHDLGKCYHVYSHPLYRLIDRVGWRKPLGESFWALRNVYLEIRPGDCFGIVGSNGAGKSTLLKIISGITQPSEGHAAVHGLVASILELGTGFHPEFSGRNNIYLNCALQGLTREQTERLIPQIVEFAELESFIDQPVRTYSTGMVLRLAFSVATAVDPDILIVDEGLAVGDEYFRNKCLDRMNDFKKRGKTILLVSHDLTTVRHFCSKVALLDRGKLIASGTPDEVLDHYLEMVHHHRGHQEERPSTTPRWGSGEIFTQYVRVLDQRNQPCTVFDTSDPVLVEACFEVKQPVKGVVFGYQIYRSDGTYVHGSNHFWHPDSIAYDFESPGETHVIRCEWHQLPLLRGEYYLTLCCYNQFDANPQAIDHWERVCHFSITERYTDQHGIFQMDSQWVISPAPPQTSGESVT